ncbi:DUF1330 domain-containing protein [Aquimarina rhabdastrellae]
MKKIIIIVFVASSILSCRKKQEKKEDKMINETSQTTEIIQEEEKGVPAYLVASSFIPEGHASLKPYYDTAHKLLEAAGGETIIAGHSGQVRHHFEGEWNEGAAFTIFKFPSMEALLGFWNSEEYQKVKHLRTDIVPPNFTFATRGFIMADMENYLDDTDNISSKEENESEEESNTNIRSAYLIASSFMPEGHPALDDYYHAAHPPLEAAGGETIIAGSSKQIMHHLEGNWNKDAAFTVFKFPTMEALLEFWNSEEYQKIKHLRTDRIKPNFTFATEGILPVDLERYQK